MLTTQVQSQPLATEFFTRALRSRSLAHAYVLKGCPPEDMYQMALDVAKILNCQEPTGADQACGACHSCRWVDQNAHPAVITVSRRSYLVSDDAEDLSLEASAKVLAKAAKTQIVGDQITRLQQQLARSSEYFRVVIFTDVEEKPASSPSSVIAPNDWRSIPGMEEKSFHIRPLNRKVLNATSANRFLKTLEEPPSKTLFFFLTDSEENLLETIVSRCQVVPFIQQARGAELPDPYYSFLEQWVSAIGPRTDIYTLHEQFESYFITEEKLSMPQALEILQTYLRERFLSGVQVEAQVFSRYTRWQTDLEKAHRMLQAKTHESQTLSYLLLQLSQP